MIAEQTVDEWEMSFFASITDRINKQKELLKPVFEFLGKHGIGEYHLDSSVSHDEFISIAYTAFIYNFKPKYHFYVHDLYGRQYIKSQLTFIVEGCNGVTIFRNERINKEDIVESLAIPLALKDSEKVIVDYTIYDKIKETIDLFTKKPNPIIVEKPIYIDRPKKVKPITNTKKVCYLMVDSSTKYVKIGNSINPHKRERTLQSEKPTIEILHIFNKNIDSDLHNKYSKRRVRGEWFKLTSNEVKQIINKYERI